MSDKRGWIPVGDEQEAGDGRMNEILDGYHKDMRCPKCGGPIEVAFTTACWRCQQALEIENLRTQLWAYETPLSKVIGARLKQLVRRLR